MSRCDATARGMSPHRLSSVNKSAFESSWMLAASQRTAHPHDCNEGGSVAYSDGDARRGRQDCGAARSRNCLIASNGWRRLPGWIGAGELHAASGQPIGVSRRTPCLDRLLPFRFEIALRFETDQERVERAGFYIGNSRYFVAVRPFAARVEQDREDCAGMGDSARVRGMRCNST